MEATQNGAASMAPPSQPKTHPSQGAPSAVTGDSVLDLHSDDVFTPKANRLVTPESVSDLLPSMIKIGQQVPGIVYPHPEQPGKWICAAGNRRLLCCRILGKKFKAIVAKGPVTKAELRRMRVTENCLRKAMTSFEIAAEIQEHIKETNCSQEAAAEFFSLSTGQVSKLLSTPRRLDPSLHSLVQNFTVCQDVARIVSTLPTHERQREVMKRVIDHDMKRDAVAALVKSLHRGDREARPKAMRLKAGGVEAVVKNPTLEAVQAFAEGLLAAVKKLAKDKSEIHYLPSVLASTVKA